MSRPGIIKIRDYKLKIKNLIEKRNDVIHELDNFEKYLMEYKESPDAHVKKRIAEVPMFINCIKEAIKKNNQEKAIDELENLSQHFRKFERVL